MRTEPTRTYGRHASPLSCVPMKKYSTVAVTLRVLVYLGLMFACASYFVTATPSYRAPYVGPRAVRLSEGCFFIVFALLLFFDLRDHFRSKR